MALIEPNRSVVFRELSELVGAEMRVEFAAQNVNVANMETRLMAHVHAEVESSMRWIVGVVIGFAALLVTAMALFI